MRDLRSKLDASEIEQKLAVNEALSAIEKDRDQLRNNLGQTELKHRLAEQALRERYEIQIKDRDQAIERLRDMKARLSTKMVGEVGSLPSQPAVGDGGEGFLHLSYGDAF